MKKFLTKTMLAVGVAATVLAGAYNPTQAAPLAANSAAVKEAAPSDDVTPVRRWHRGWGGALLGIGAAALIYEGVRRSNRGYYGYGPGPYYGYGYGRGIRYSYNPYYGRYVPDCNHRGRIVC